jgi:uncharacterized protein (DUF2336 family)
MSAASLITELDDMIQRGSPGRRAETLRRIAALFAESATKYNSEHVDLFEQIFDRLLAEVDAAARTELAHRLCTIPSAPRGVLRRLAADENIATARPILTRSPVLLDDDLLEIAETRGQGHLLALAKRKQITRRLAEKLADRGGREVLRSLVENPGAEMGEGAFSALVRRAAGDGRLAEKIATRRDFPARMLRELATEATASTRERLLASVPLERQVELRGILAELIDQPQTKAVSRDYAAAERKILELRQEGKLDEGALLGFARGGQYEELIVGLASFCGLSIDVADRLMNADRADPMLILCKAAGWSWPTVKTLMSAPAHSHRISDIDLDAAYDNFERLSPATAQRVMRFWQVQQWQRTTGT